MIAGNTSVLWGYITQGRPAAQQATEYGARGDGRRQWRRELAAAVSRLRLRRSYADGQGFAAAPQATGWALCI
jgi:hypothetical protein